MRAVQDVAEGQEPGEAGHAATGGRVVGLVLRRANVSRAGGTWNHEDFDVFDGERKIGRIYLSDRFSGYERWFWGAASNSPAA
jgi:hypothetical protein